MKKLFLILFLACNFVAHAGPLFKTGNFRWRNDNGNETSATWKAAINTPVTLTSRNQNIRLRVNIYCESTGWYLSHNKFYYSKNGGEKVLITNDVSKDFIFSSSSSVSNGTTTTNQLPPTVYTFLNGYFNSEVISTENQNSQINLDPSFITEVEYCIRATAAAANSATYTFYPDIDNTTYVNQPASLTTQFCVEPPTPTTNFSSGGINYIVTSPTTVAVDDNTSATGVVVIPDEVTVDCQTLAVTSIAANAFSGCTGLTSITIPSTVTSIGTNAFFGCTGLTSVVCNASNPIPIDTTVFAGVNQANCSLNVPNASIAAYQAATIWQNFTPIVCNQRDNTTDVLSFCNYTWSNNNQTYTSSGLYTGLTTNCVTEKINLTIITTAPTNFSSGGINYVVTSPTTIAVRYNRGATGAIVIPAAVTTSCGTYAVTSINNLAFNSSTGLTSVTIPNSVTSIGNDAFNGCTGLTSITIGNSVTSIAAYAFSGCTGLTSVTIPNSVTSIAANAFSGCTGLTSLTLGNSLTSIGNSAFYGCGGLTSITIPNSVTSIGNGAFQSCYNLTSVAIPNSLTSIAANAFSGCTGLTSVNIPNSVTSIGNSAFNTCTGLTSITIGNSVTSIGSRAFANCFSLTSFICNLSTPINIDTDVFADVNQGTCRLAVPNSSVAAYQAAAVWKNFNPINSIVFNTTTISANCSYTWANNTATYTATGVYIGTTTNGITEQLDLTITTQPTNFTNDGINYVVTSPTTVAVGVNASATGVVVIPNSVTTACGTYAVTAINGSAFQSRSGLTSVTIPNTVTSIGSGAFASSGLTSIILPNSVTSIAGYAFYGCSGLTSVTLPNAITSLSEGVFQNCSSLTSVTIPNTVTSIGNQVFQNCSSLTSVTIPNTVTSMGNQVFQYCSGLTSVSISNSVPSIGNQFFQFCTSLTSVTIPNSVTSIGQIAFQGCSSLSSVTLSNSLTSIGSGAFIDCNVLSTITIPNSVTSIGSYAFVYCSDLTSVTIGNSVTSIGSNAFAGCTGLASVICNVSSPIAIAANVFAGVTQAACSLTVPAGSVAAYQTAAVWQNFAPITCSGQVENTTVINAVGCYYWSNTGQTYTQSGIYIGNTSNCIIEKLNLTITNAILTQPINATICNKVGVINLTASIAPIAGATYQWQVQTATGTTWENANNSSPHYSGVTTPVLNIQQATASMNNNKYKLVVTAPSACTVSSDICVLTVNPIPTGALISGAGTICENSAKTLRIANTIVGSVQWQVSTVDTTTGFTDIEGATGSIYTTDALTATSYYRVVVSSGVCDSKTSQALTVTVIPAPLAGTISGGDVTVCTYATSGLDLSGNSVPFSNSTLLSAAGTTGSILWQKSTNYVNTTGATPVWTSALSTTDELSVTDLTVDTWYRVLVSNGACTVASTPVKITVTKAAKAGTIASASSVCTGGDITFTSSAYTGSSIQWEVSTTSPTSGFEAVVGANGSTFIMNAVSYAPLSKFYVRNVVTTGNCTIARSAVKPITVNPLAFAGPVAGGGTICLGANVTMRLSGYIGAVQWQSSTDGINYFNAPSGSSIHTASNITADTYFRVKVTSGACSVVYSNVVKYTIGTATAGTLTTANTTVCKGSGTTLTLTGSDGTIKWLKSFNWTATSPTWTTINSTATTLATGNLSVSTAYKAEVTIGSCSTLTSEVVPVYVYASPLAKTITANVTFPSGTTSALAICTTSTTSKELIIGANSIGAIQWQRSSTSATTGFTDITDATGTRYIITNPTEGANYFRAKFTNSCGVSVFGTAFRVYYKACTSTKAITSVVTGKTSFAVVSYPNPFTNNFNLNVTSPSSEKVSVVVYDMIGRVLEKHLENVSEINSLAIGNNYPTGVYNIIVTQGMEVKTVRVIKK